MNGEAPDAALVRLALAGDRDAFAALVVRHSATVVRLCRRHAGTTLADDCVQDTLLTALLRLGSLRDPDAFGSWLRGIALNVCRRVRARSAGDPLSFDDLSGMWLPGPELAASLEQRYDSAELGLSVRSAVARLPVGQRHAVELFYLRDHSYEESAALLGIAVGALKTRLHKARAALAQHFRPEKRQCGQPSAERQRRLRISVSER